MELPTDFPVLVNPNDPEAMATAMVLSALLPWLKKWDMDVPFVHLY